MQGTEKLTATIAFRASEKMVNDVETYRRGRRLPKLADAARELMESALASPALLQAATEARALGFDPITLIRERVAQISTL